MIVLDVCCGGRSFWFEKENDFTIFMDNRVETIKRKDTLRKNGKRWGGWIFSIKPDIQADFSNIPFKSNTFNLVIFDPPHAKFGKSSYMAKQYGSLCNNWRDVLKSAFSECFRVLKKNSILIFKWNEIDIKVREILELTPEKPLFGHKSGKQMNTHWITFLKGVAK